MTLTRRDFLAGAVAAIPAAALAAQAQPAAKKTKMGFVIHSFTIRRGLNDPLKLLDYAVQAGVGGVQIGLGVRDEAWQAAFREKLAQSGAYFEGMTSLPRDRDAIARFEQELLTAKGCGVTILRCACLSGRRYETFNTREAFREFADKAWQSLTLAEPLAAKHGIKLAVENHKDFRVEEMVAMLKKLSSAHVGVTVDTGNSISLLEEPHAVVEAYAPYAFSTHLKDMGVAEYPDGFLLSEVPLGEGFLDMPRIVETLRKANPAIRINLEMMTRDPLKVPCLTDKYWATFDSLPGKYLAETLARVRHNLPKQPLQQPTKLPADGQQALEDENIAKCIAYARDKLKLV